MKRKTEIEIEMNEVIAYSRPRERFRAVCEQCQSPTEMVAPHIAAVLARTTEREIYRLIEIGALHFVEADGVLICLNFLINCRKDEKPNDPLFSNGRTKPPVERS